MSRRCHHGSPRHLRQTGRERRRGPGLAERPPITPAEPFPGGPSDAFAEPADAEADLGLVGATDDGPDLDLGGNALPVAAAPTGPAAVALPPAGAPPIVPSTPDSAPPPAPARAQFPSPRAGAQAGPVVQSAAVAQPLRPPHRPREAGPNGDGAADMGPERGATAPQLRRFIKSRAYVPMHELRRRFAINGGDDDVIPIDIDRQRVYVGLPPREGSLLGELLRAGDIGYELSLDPIAPIVVGVYPMRPVPRS
jgi:hypothetical protein